MATPYEKLRDKVEALERECTDLKSNYALLKASVTDHEEDLNDFKKSIDALKETVSKWSGALLVAGPILTFIASYIAGIAAP